MLKIRLQRTGKKHDAGYRIVVAEHTAPIKWKFIEKLWFFMARKKADTLKIDTERVKHWMSVWAQPSETVARLLSWQWLKEEVEKFIPIRATKTSKVELEAIKKKEEEKKAKIEDDLAKEEAKKAKEAEELEKAAKAEEEASK